MLRLDFVDSHTGGEPTRVITADELSLGAGTIVQRAAVWESAHARLRSGIILEPRGYPAMVGALLVPPDDDSCCTGAIFFNNVGCLGMCVHGTIGVAVTLAALGRIGPGRQRLETPVGVVEFELLPDRLVAVMNVPSYVTHPDVVLSVPNWGTVHGQIAWGGNPFFLVEHSPVPVEPDQIPELMKLAKAIQGRLDADEIRGWDGLRPNHIELFGPPSGPHADSRNFVLCPGAEFDRSPCGTGTSAKVANLVSRGHLPLGATWRQESITGSVFSATATACEPPLLAPSGTLAVRPQIVGEAHLTARGELLFDDRDPLRHGWSGPNEAGGA
jgi:4-hydroxyproline epimerase